MLASTPPTSSPGAPLLARVEHRYRPREEERPYEPKGAALALLLDRSPEVVLEGPAGTGKAQPLDAPVWTPTGACRMGNLAVGDLVLTPDGGVAPIAAIPFRDMAPVYRVTFSDGAQVECSDGHLWTVAWRDSSEREHVQTLPLATLLAMGLRKRNGSRPRFWVPQTAPVALAAQPVPIPPYTLGVLLGDGYIRDGETSFTTADSAIADRVAAEMAPQYRVTAATKAGNAASAYRIVAHGWRPTRGASGKAGYVSRTISGKWMARLRQPGLAATAARYIGSFDTPELAQAAIDAQAATVFTAAQRTGVPGLSQTLEQLGLRNARSATKFVPEVYKQNSAAVRWEVLRGLMDTDGYADRATVNFTSISRQLAEDVRWLVQSLGGTAHITTKQPRGGQLAYTVWIRLPDPAEAFHLERKRVKAGVRQVPVRRWIESVDFIGSQLCQCITVGTAEGLYLTEGFVVTHNSRALLEKAHLCAVKYDGCRILLVRKTRESMTESCLVTYEEKVLPEGSPIAEGPKRDTRKAYQYPNGSTIVVAGLVASGKDQRAKVMSTEYDLILVFEATELSEHEYEQLTSRLRNGRMPYQQILSDCNPDIPTHWLHQRCDKGIARVHHSRHEDNPLLYRDGAWTARGQAYLATLDRMSGARRERLRFGRRAASEGLVYENWDPGVHVLPATFPIPAEWTRLRVIDFGFTNPFVCQWYALDGDKRAYRYREIYMSGRTVAEHIETIKRVERWYLEDGSPNSERERIQSTIADHDAEDRETLAKAGISSIGAYKAVQRGIQAVQERLKLAGDGRPRLYLVAGALVERDEKLVEAKRPWCTEQEFDGYRWPKGQDGRTVKEEPVKENDHGMDSVRYLVAQLDLRGGTGGSLIR